MKCPWALKAAAEKWENRANGCVIAAFFFLGGLFFGGGWWTLIGVILEFAGAILAAEMGIRRRIEAEIALSDYSR